MKVVALRLRARTKKYESLCRGNNGQEIWEQYFDYLNCFNMYYNYAKIDSQSYNYPVLFGLSEKNTRFSRFD